MSIVPSATREPESPSVEATVTVTVRDRSAESPWGSGPVNPVIRKVTISAFCPQPGCSSRRGEPRGLNQHDDGNWYWTQVWENPCGHIDMYSAVVAEASARVIAARAALTEDGAS